VRHSHGPDRTRDARGPVCGRCPPSPSRTGGHAHGTIDDVTSSTGRRPGAIEDLTTLLFDVMGTVVDDEVSLETWSTQRLAVAGVDHRLAVDVVRDCQARLARLMDDVVSGAAPWHSHRALRSTALRESLAAAQLSGISAPIQDELSQVIAHLDPFPDAPEALARLRMRCRVVALSNADLAELAGLSAHARLSWHAVVSGELVKSFKPDPAVYTLALTMLELDPRRTMMVAAHPWDLRAAAAHGLRTVYVARPGADRPRHDDVVDLSVADLGELADLLAGPS
jgi:2-haloacid dehalogenase